MLRTHLKQLALVVTFATVACASARANFYLDVQYASGGDPGSTPYAVNVSSPNTTVTLDVYAFITDDSPSSTNDQYKSAIASFFVAGSANLGDVAWGSWSGNVAATFATKGSQFTTSFGGLGLGGSSTSDNVAAHLWDAPANGGGGYINGTNASPAGFAATISGSTGFEYLLGSLTVTFTRNAFLTSASEPFSVQATNRISIVRAFNWLDSVTTTNTGTFGSASNVGDGNYDLSPGDEGHLVFNFGGGPNPAALSASIAITGPTTLLGGTSTSLTGSVTNSAAGPAANALNWSASFPGIVTLSPSSANGVANGTSTPVTGSLGATPSGFGPWSTNVIFSGTDASLGTVAIGSPLVKNLAFTIIGSGTKATADGAGIPGGSYGNLMTTQGSLAGGASLAGLTTTLGSGANSFGIGHTTVTILAGNLATSTTGISEQWRSRASFETPGGSVAAGGAPQFLPLYGDVVNLTGITGGSSTVFALQMTYDPNELGGAASAASAASNGFLFLGYRSSDGRWYNATNSSRSDGNVGVGANAGTNFQGSFAAFTAANNFSLANLLGSWGVDTANDTVWAVINHDAEFAPVPEPGTIALLIGGIAAVGFAYRRRKVTKA